VDTVNTSICVPVISCEENIDEVCNNDNINVPINYSAYIIFNFFNDFCLMFLLSKLKFDLFLFLFENRY